MSMVKTLVAAFIGAAVAISASVYGLSPQSGRAAPTQETVLQRIERTGEIRCGYFSWPPYVERDAVTGKLSGINADMAEAVAADLGWKVNWAMEVGPGEAIAALNADKIDMMCASLWPDGPRAKSILLTAATFYTGLYAIVRAGDARFDGDLAKLNSGDVTLAAMDGDATYTIAKNNYPGAKIYSLPQAADAAQLLLAVADGKADAVIMGLSDINHYNATNERKLVPVAGVPAAHVFAESFGLKAGEFALQATLNSVIQRLNDNGLAAAMLKKYSMQGYYAPRAGF